MEKFDVGDASLIGAIGFFVGFVVSMFLLGLVLILLAPRAAEAVARTGRRKPLVCAGVGLLGIILIPVHRGRGVLHDRRHPARDRPAVADRAAPARSRYVTTALVLGRLILKKSKFLAFLVGLVILGLLTLIPIAGGLIGFLAIVFGLGALLVTLLHSRS